MFIYFETQKNLNERILNKEKKIVLNIDTSKLNLHICWTLYSRLILSPACMTFTFIIILNQL